TACLYCFYWRSLMGRWWHGHAGRGAGMNALALAAGAGRLARRVSSLRAAAVRHSHERPHAVRAFRNK
ncbi:hypothetical protein EVAR_97639_1, partial [Eumeta japonica]